MNRYKLFSVRSMFLWVTSFILLFSTSTSVYAAPQSEEPVPPSNHDAHRVTAGGQEISLTPKEYELLHYLASSPDKVFSREELLKDVWNYEFFGDLRTVDTHVKRLREKLNKVSAEAAAMITTVWGVGYKLEVPK